MILLISLPHFDLLSERILERIFESLKSLQDVVTGSADLAFFLDRILHPRSVFFLSIKDSRCL